MRELMEELGIAPDLRGPVYHASSTFEYEGGWVNNRDVFFLARWHGPMPTLTGVNELERKAMREVRWWTLDDLRSTRETVYPTGLADVLPTLLDEGLQAADE